MGSIIEWLFEEVFRGIFEWIGETIWKRLPKPVRIGCGVIFAALVIALIGAIIMALLNN